MEDYKSMTHDADGVPIGIWQCEGCGSWLSQWEGNCLHPIPCDGCGLSFPEAQAEKKGECLLCEACAPQYAECAHCHQLVDWELRVEGGPEGFIRTFCDSQHRQEYYEESQ